MKTVLLVCVQTGRGFTSVVFKQDPEEAKLDAKFLIHNLV